MVLALNVADAEVVFAQAVAAGAEIRQPLAEMFWGDRRRTWRTRRGDLAMGDGERHRGLFPYLSESQ